MGRNLLSEEGNVSTINCKDWTKTIDLPPNETDYTDDFQLPPDISKDST
jgi:hypothetical protein